MKHLVYILSAKSAKKHVQDLRSFDQSLKIILHRISNCIPTSLHPQQGSETNQISRKSLVLVREMFPGRLISKHGDIGRPPSSTDFTPCDFCLKGFLKSKLDRQALNAL